MKISYKKIIINSSLLVTILYSNILGQRIDGVAGIIGDELILESDIQNQKIQAEQSKYIFENDKAECEILNNLIFEKLLINQAILDSVEVTDDKVNAEVENRIRYFEAQAGGTQKLEEFFGKSISEIKFEFFDAIKDNLLAEEVRNKIIESINLKPKDVKKYYNALSDNDVPIIESQVKYAQIVLDIAITQEDKNKLIDKLNVLREDIISGKRTFAASAVLYSMDPGSKNDGGEFDWVNRGTFVPEFDEKAFTMQIGEITKPFETMYGYHIMELIDRRGNMYKGRHILLPFESSSNQDKITMTKADSIRTEIMNGKISFEDAAKIYNEDSETKFSNGIKYNMENASSYFNMGKLDKTDLDFIKGLKQGEISKVKIFIDNTGKKKIKFLKILELKDPHKANIKDDYNTLYNIAYADEKTKLLENWISIKQKEMTINIAADYQACKFYKELMSEE